MSGAQAFVVRNAAEVATAALVDAFNASFADYLISFPTLDNAGWQAFVRRQGIDVAQSLVACRGDVVVAFAMITPRPLQRTRIAVMGARPEARGSGAAVVGRCDRRKRCAARSVDRT